MRFLFQIVKALMPFSHDKLHTHTGVRTLNADKGVFLYNKMLVVDIFESKCVYFAHLRERGFVFNDFGNWVNQFCIIQILAFFGLNDCVE
jgi:hypothetical protein